MSAADVAAFRQAIARLEAIQAGIVELSAGDGEDWRRDLIAARRELQAQIATLATLLHGMGGGEEIRQLRDAVNRMRSKVALHQANWPAVHIDRDDPDYRTSVQDVRAANRDLIAATHRLLANR